MTLLISFVVGLIFGLGLIVSGMADPGKVTSFLDLTGNFDPSLVMVMAGAIAVGATAFRQARRMGRTLLGSPMQLPEATPIDRRLLLGSTLFGIGWGLAGICPGPGLVLLGMGDTRGLMFCLAMLGGMALFKRLQRPHSNLASA